MPNTKLPIARWLPRYERKWLAPDVVAGLTVWALVVPEAMAYASIAGVPVQYGLYSVPLAVIGYAIFGTSRRLFNGPSSEVAALAAATVAPLAAAASDKYIALMAALALLVGVLFIALGLLRMGWIAHFFAKPVLDGFIVGLGIFIAVGQLNKIVGIDKPEGNTVEKLWGVLKHLADWHWTTVVVGLAALAVLFLLPKRWPRVPGALVVLILGIAVTSALHLDGRGVEVIGKVPTGFHFVPWSGVTLGDVGDMVPGAFGIVVVAFAQSLAIAKSYVRKDDPDIDPDGEMVAYGAASIGAGVLQGFPPAGSLSKSAAAAAAGERTPVAYLVVAALVVLTTLLIAGVFENLPEAVLGAIVVHAVWEMIDFGKLTRLRRAHLADFWLALVALAGVLLVGVLAGIVLGVVLSLVLLIHRLDHPRIASLGRRPDTRFSDIESDPDAAPVPGVLIFRLEGPLIFANAEVVTGRLLDRVERAGPDVATVILDFEAVYEIDTEGVDLLVGLIEELADRHIRLVVARAHAAVRDYMERDGQLEKIGRDNLVATVDDAITQST